MWICTKFGFYSIVDAASQPNHLLVRARRPGDIERIFPDAAVKETLGRDYRYRAELPRVEVAQRFFELLMEHDAHNFKASVRDKQLHDVYMSAWSVFGRLQKGGPYGDDDRQSRLF